MYLHHLIVDTTLVMTMDLLIVSGSTIDDYDIN